MTGIGNLTLNALAGTVLLDAWLLVAMGLQSGRRPALVFVPFLAAQATALYVLRAPRSILWDLVASALATPLFGAFFVVPPLVASVLQRARRPRR